MNRINRMILRKSPGEGSGTSSRRIGRSGFAVILLLLALAVGCELEIERRSEQKPGATVD